MLVNILLFLSTLFLISGEKDYCNVCPDHTMCIYKGIGKACGIPTVYKHDLNKTEQQILVDLHNELRNDVALGKERRGSQPPASNMRKLTWDDELALFAQRWAQQCIFGHDTCRNTEKFKVMQNVYQGWYTEPLKSYNFSAYVANWYDEVTTFNKKNINPYKFEMPCGHYTQVVWAESYLLGCGLFSFQSGLFQYYLVCNYAPGGNIIDQSMYKAGVPASQCPNGTTKDVTYPGLCS